MKYNPLVSVIVISYNHGKFINENLDSILAQDYDNIELILADDASKDNSIQIYDNWLIKNRKVAKKNYHKVNTGLATTLNECIEMAEGQYIKLIAADDFFHKTYISRCVNYLLETQTLAVYTQAFLIDSESNILGERCFPEVQYGNLTEMLLKLIENNFVPGSTLFTHADVYRKIGLYKKNTLLEDYNLALRLAERGILIGKLSEQLIYYRSHDKNITKLQSSRLNVDTIREKISFDKNGSYSHVTGKSVRDEVISGNPMIKELRKVYRKQKKKDIKTLISLYFPTFFLAMRRVINR